MQFNIEQISPYQMAGWVFEPEGDQVNIEVWSNGFQIASAAADKDRPDVARGLPNTPQAKKCGFALPINLSPGLHNLEVYAVSRKNRAIIHSVEFRIFTEAQIEEANKADQDSIQMPFPFDVVSTVITLTKATAFDFSRDKGRRIICRSRAGSCASQRSRACARFNSISSLHAFCF